MKNSKDEKSEDFFSIKTTHKHTHFLFMNPSETLDAGVDEAGRGSLISRVYAAVVVIDDPDEFVAHAQNEGVVIRDSKKMSRLQREKARVFIERHAVMWGVGWASREEIDAVNILQASILAMHRALQQLPHDPDRIMVDGDVFRPYKDIPHVCIPHGDDKIVSIMCAGILAKTHRDAYITTLVEHSPELRKYGVPSNMGYGSRVHMDALHHYGKTPHHRQSFCSSSSTPRQHTHRSLLRPPEK